MSIQTIINKLIEITPQRLEGLAYVGDCGGLVNSTETARHTVRTPCVLYGALSARMLPDKGNEQLNIEWLCAAYCLVALKHAPEGKSVHTVRHAAARALAEQTALMISQFRLAGTQRPLDIMITEINEPSENDLEDQGISGYAVTWRQGVALGTDVWADDRFMPEEVYLGVAPRIGLAHINDYWRIHNKLTVGLTQ